MSRSSSWEEQRSNTVRRIYGVAVELAGEGGARGEGGRITHFIGEREDTVGHCELVCEDIHEAGVVRWSRMRESMS